MLTAIKLFGNFSQRALPAGYLFDEVLPMGHYPSAFIIPLNGFKNNMFLSFHDTNQIGYVDIQIITIVLTMTNRVIYPLSTRAFLAETKRPPVL